MNSNRYCVHGVLEPTDEKPTKEYTLKAESKRIQVSNLQGDKRMIPIQKLKEVF